MKKFRFRKFPIYKDARKFRLELKSMSVKNFPKIEDYCLRSQLWRALDSILLNIAEGADRGTDKDFAHFLNNSHTSLNEVVSCLDLAYDDKYISKLEFERYSLKAEEIGKMIWERIQRLTTKN